MKLSNKFLVAAFASFAVFAISFQSFAGGAFYSKNGKPYTWKDGIVSFKYDPGRLSSRIKALPTSANESYCKALSTDPCETMDKCGAVACVEHLFDKWASTKMLVNDDVETKVDVVDLTVTNKGAISVKDITADNYEYYQGIAANQNVILVIFDDDGSIIANEAKKSCEGLSDKDDRNECFSSYLKQKASILGLSEPFKNSATNYYKGGVIIFNGLWLNKDSDSSTYDPEDISDKLFAASMLHEVGHSLGLDHALPKDCYDADDAVIPTMYPKLQDNEGTTQYELSMDDVVAIATLYPEQAFDDQFCTIIGDVVNEDGARIQGINVIAYAEDGDSKYSDQRTFVSGSYYKANTPNGHYILNGIMPCKKYKVILEAVPDEFQNFQFGLNPYGSDPNVEMEGYDESDIPNSIYLTTNSNATDVVRCNPENICGDETSLKAAYILASNGKIISMDNPPALGNIADDDDSDDGSSGVKKKGWCMSVGGGFAPEFGYGFLAMLGFGFALRRKFKNRS